MSFCEILWHEFHFDISILSLHFQWLPVHLKFRPFSSTPNISLLLSLLYELCTAWCKYVCSWLYFLSFIWHELSSDVKILTMNANERNVYDFHSYWNKDAYYSYYHHSTEALHDAKKIQSGQIFLKFSIIFRFLNLLKFDIACFSQ